MIFYDGIAHKIDDVEFVIQEDDYCKPWKFTSSDGRFEMDFLPILDRSACLDYKLIVSDQHQVFGRIPDFELVIMCEPLEKYQKIRFLLKMEWKK